MSLRYVYQEHAGWREARRYWTHGHKSRDILAMLHREYPELRKKSGAPLDMRSLYNHANVWGWPKRDTEGQLIGKTKAGRREPRRVRQAKRQAIRDADETQCARRCPDCFGVYRGETCPYPHTQTANRRAA